MAVDERLKKYWTNVKNLNHTGDEVWLSLLEILAMSTHDPLVKRESNRFLSYYHEEVRCDPS